MQLVLLEANRKLALLGCHNEIGHLGVESVWISYLWHTYIAYYGLPVKIVTDQDRNFESDLIGAL